MVFWIYRVKIHCTALVHISFQRPPNETDVILIFKPKCNYFQNCYILIYIMYVTIFGGGDNGHHITCVEIQEHIQLTNTQNR